MGTHYKGNERDQLALNTFIKLMRAANSINLRLNLRQTFDGITESQFGVLEAIYHLGPMCQKDLARKILKTGGNMTTVIDNLERKALVRRQRSAPDRRFVTIELTEKGRKTIKRVFPKHVAAIVAEFLILSVSEQKALGILCTKIGRRQKTT